VLFIIHEAMHASFTAPAQECLVPFIDEKDPKEIEEKGRKNI
jgi:hypothetical protein